MKLQNKLLSFLMPAGLVAASSILFLIYRSVHSVILKDLEKNVTAVARATAQDSAPIFNTINETQLLSQLQSLQNREGALYAAALDRRGTVLAHTTIKYKGAIQDDPFTESGLISDQSVVHIVSQDGEPVLEVGVPVWSAPKAVSQDSFLFSGEANMGPKVRLGLLKVGVPLKQTFETEDSILRVIFLIFVVIGGLTATFILLFVRGVLKPVNSLMAGISKISQGRYDVEVPVRTTDELGDLALSFNRMSSELARTTVSKNYVEGILANMLDLLVVTDASGAIETMNPAMLEALGYSSDEMTGNPLFSLFQDAPAPLRNEQLPALMAAGGVHDLEVSLLSKSGRAIPALFSASILKDHDGRLQGYIGVSKDMTERKRAEEALLAAKTAAEIAGKELEAFSYSVAHDLRAPLRAVDGFSQIVLDRYSEKLDDQGRDFLRRIRAGSRRMGTLIDDLLNLSRITRSTMRMEQVDLTALAREIAAELKKSQPKRKAAFVIAEGLTAKGDSNLLRVVLVNLLGNAWKYTGKHPSARIEFGAAPGADRTVYFVRDDGAGFDMSFSKKLFKAFNRLHAAAEFEGTGIGLATVQRVIDRHGGNVWGESAVEKGATFYFTLWEGANHGNEEDSAHRG